MAIKQVERDLTFRERIYILEILKALRLTARHFFRNLFIHIAHRFGLVRHLRGGVTYQYPEERRPFSPRLRTLHRLTRRQDGSPRCVACMMCETVCPAHCIYIVGGSIPILRLKNTRCVLTLIWVSVFFADIAWKPARRMPFGWTPGSWNFPPTAEKG